MTRGDVAGGAAPGLVGLVLAGGASRRMGRDKGALQLDGQSLAERAVGQLELFCTTVCVSVRAAQATSEPYRRLRLVLDQGGIVGPAAGLLAAWRRYPGQALLVLAADLARVDARLIGALVAGRRTGQGAIATAFRHPRGPVEPLCAIWEPAAEAALRRAERPGAPSLRGVLEAGDAAVLDPEWPDQLASVNTPDAYDAARIALEG